MRGVLAGADPNGGESVNQATIKARVTDLQDRLDRLRPDYDRAKAAHAQGASTRDAAWVKLHALFADFRAGDGGDKAIYLLGRASQVAADADAAGAVIAEHDELRERLRKLEALLPKEAEG